jgi:hypothetical protein
MAYDPVTDFLTLARQTSGGVRIESMPGLDYVLVALERMGFCNVWINPSTPPTNATTAWLKTSSTSYATEGSVFLYDPVTDAFEPATPELWQLLFVANSSASFQRVSVATADVLKSTVLLAVQRDNPGVTTLNLPSVLLRTQALEIVDWSTNVAAHEIRINPAVGQTIMQRAEWSLFSTADQLAGITLHPSPDLNGWVIAP